MELEYIPDGSDRCPLIIMSPITPTNTEQLYKVLQDDILGFEERLIFTLYHL